MEKYYVQVIKYDHEEVVEEIECGNVHKAEKVDIGININLNHDEYFTNIVSNSERQLL